jgi:FkbH-like protein
MLQESNDMFTEKSRKMIKCVVWDLDDTLWYGTLLEDDTIVLREGMIEIIQELDRRGILQSIASKNDTETALKKLQDFGLCEFFIYPQINWNSKVTSIKTIAEAINISLDTVAFVDDQIYEREEVHFSLPEVRSMDVVEIAHLLDMPETQPRFLTEDTKRRRLMYLSEINRKEAEKAFQGPATEFLATIDMRLTIARAHADDLMRAEELTLRTNQLNTTGYTYSYEELDQFRKSSQHDLLIARLEDKYGTYGTIGLALIERQAERWIIKLLLMSCRVVSRGVGSVMIGYILRQARQAQVPLYVEFIPNQRNRMMYVTLKLAGFKETLQEDHQMLLMHTTREIQQFPSYITMCTPELI